MCLEMLSAKWHPFYPGEDELSYGVIICLGYGFSLVHLARYQATSMMS